MAIYVLKSINEKGVDKNFTAETRRFEKIIRPVDTKHDTFRMESDK